MNNVLLRGSLTMFAILLLAVVSAFGQQRTVTGTVLDSESNEPLPGVSILVKGTNGGTATGPDGNYSLQVGENATLVFSFIGYKSQEVAVGNQSVINVNLEIDVVALDEIVVIGYGTVKKEDLTGSVTAVSSKDFNEGVISSPQELLMGRTSGVQITTGSGAPGSGSQIMIRGGSSLSASNDPLIVIDGVPLSPGGTSGMRNPLNIVNPSDIESFTVLKDASATAIYGSRASNGVIIITTKRGEEGKTQFKYNGSFTMNTLPAQLDVLTGDEIRTLVNEKIAAGDLDASVASLLGTENTNWQSLVLQNSTSHDHNISMAGSLANVPVRASVGYTNQNGLVKTSYMERTSLSIGLDPTFLKDQIKMKINFKGSGINNQFADWGAISAAVQYDPTQPVYDAYSPFGGYSYWEESEGDLVPGNYPKYKKIFTAPSNPLALLEQRENTSSVLGMIGNVELKYSPSFMPELTGTVNLATERNSSVGSDITAKNASWAYDATNGSGYYTDYDAFKKNDLLETYLNYDKQIGDQNISLMAGYSWQHFFGEGSSITQNYDKTYEISEYDEGKGENYLISFFGRANYSYMDKYYVTATLREDGSSKFGPENRWGLFPSLALAWDIQRESFFEDVAPISTFKLRLGYGVTGQQEIGPNYGWLPTVTFSDERAQYRFGDTFYNMISFQAYDADLKWEETTTYNVGLDFGLWSDRINGSVEYYKRRTADLLNNVPISIGTNFSNFLTTNIGTMDIKGVEFNIDARVIENSDFSWDFGMNFTATQNDITKLTLVNDPDYLGVFNNGVGGGVGTTIGIHSVGYERSTFFTLEQVYDAEGMPIEGLYVDQNEDGVINDEDRIRWENPAPEMYMGFSSRFAYKNFDLALNARMNVGNFVYDNISSQYTTTSHLYNATGNNINNMARTYSWANFKNPQYYSKFYLYDASFFRMDNISLGYNLGNKLSEKFTMALRGTVQNAFVISDYHGLDPEIASGVDNNMYPRPRTFVFGVNLNF